jgi:hypothetical protein
MKNSKLHQYFITRKDIVLPESPIGIIEKGNMFKAYPGSSNSEMAFR